MGDTDTVSPRDPSTASGLNLSYLAAGETFAPPFASTPEPRKAVRRTSAVVAGDGVVKSSVGLSQQQQQVKGDGDGCTPPAPPAEPAPVQSPTKQPTTFSPSEFGPSFTNVLLEEDADALDVTNYTGPYKQLWNLLTETADVLSLDVVYEELTRRCNSIITGLMLYEKPEERDFPKITETSTQKDKLKAEIMKTLQVQETVAMELMCLYLVYEYKGEVKPLAELVPNQLSITAFVKELTNFYYRERLSLLYCAQAILNGATSENSRYNEIFCGFVGAASMKDWCKWLSMSLRKCENHEETVEVLHTLAILLNSFAHFDGVIPSLNENCHFANKSQSKDSVYLAEAVLFCSLLQCGDARHEDHITKFIVQHARELDDNPYFYGPLISFYISRSDQNEGVRDILRFLPNPQDCAKNMVSLVKEYDRNSFRNRHGLGAIVVKANYLNAETILTNFEKSSFGSEDDWYALLDNLLRDRSTAHSFLCEQPNELTVLYTNALMKFPVENRWILSYWGAVCRTATDSFPAADILERLTEINFIAEELMDLGSVRPNGNNEWLAVDERWVGGVRVKPGILGATLQDPTETDPLIVSWTLDSPCTNATVWDILLDEVLHVTIAQAPDIPEKNVHQVCAIAEFLWELSQSADHFPPNIFKLIQPTSNIIRQLACGTTDSAEKSKYVALLLKVVTGGGQFDVNCLLGNVVGLWPLAEEQSLVCELILAHESVLNTSYLVTKTFLLHMAVLFQKDPKADPFHLLQALHHYSYKLDVLQNDSSFLHPLYTNAVRFILENVFPSFVRWRMKCSEDQFQIIRDTFRVFDNLFQFHHTSWTRLKQECCEALLTAGSSLLAVLKIDEESLQDTWIRTSKHNMYLGQTMYYALSLIVQLAKFDIRTLKVLDNASNLTLVQKLGRLVRHRINPNIPTLALDLLKRMASELNISLLACFGNGIDSFRDLLVQRVEYKTETVQLKICILDFLTICAQAQPGLIQHFFQDSTLTTSLFGLLKEKDERLVVSALCLMRALFRKGNTILKKHSGDIWKLIIAPLKSLPGSLSNTAQKSVITFTMNIFCFELHCNGLSEKDFENALRELLTGNYFGQVIMLGSETNSGTTKSLLALKHFLTLLMSQPDFETVLSQPNRLKFLRRVTAEFWRHSGNEADMLLLTALAELMFLLSPSPSASYLEEFAGSLSSCFAEAKIPVQVPLLALIAKNIQTLQEEITLSTIENTVRMISMVYYGAVKLYDADSAEAKKPLLSVAATTVYAIITSPACKNWLPIFRRQMLINSMVSVASIGLQKGAGAEVVQECLFALIKLSESELGGPSDTIRNCSLSQQLWTPAVYYADPSTEDEHWGEVYLLCCQLNTAMVKAQKFYYLEDALNFWGLHGEFMISRLHALTDLIHHSYLHSPDQNYKNIKRILAFDLTLLHAISEMVPYFQQWRLPQFDILNRIMKGVFATLETSVSLLTHNSTLQLVITKPSKQHALSFKRSPQELEIQTKLWEVLSMGVHIYWRMRRDESELITSVGLIPLLQELIGLCGRSMNKHGDKKSVPVINVTGELSMAMEKSLVLLLDHLTLVLTSDLPEKEVQAFRREAGAEAVIICDTVRRIGLPRDDFSLVLCSALEAVLKMT